MYTSRHKFACEAISLPALLATKLCAAISLEQSGSWFLAGEAYDVVRRAIEGAEHIEAQAQLAARSATCYEVCGQTRPSARAYESAANLLAHNKLRPEIAAELYNRAALQFSAAGEFFFAGSCWSASAGQFASVNKDIVDCSENYQPLPMASLKSFLCGNCHEAAANAFSKVIGQESWAVNAYWEAGQLYSTGIPNIQAFDAYFKSLKTAIRVHGTLEKAAALR
jgi:tetratricopeptide (TPR) repeat protein